MNPYHPASSNDYRTKDQFQPLFLRSWYSLFGINIIPQVYNICRSSRKFKFESDYLIRSPAHVDGAWYRVWIISKKIKMDFMPLTEGPLYICLDQLAPQTFRPPRIWPKVFVMEWELSFRWKTLEIISKEYRLGDKQWKIPVEEVIKT